MIRSSSIVAILVGAVTLWGLPRSGLGGEHSRSRGWTTLLTLASPGPRQVHFNAGQFRMGSTPEEVLSALTQCTHEPLSQQCPDFSDEQPVRQIMLSAFSLDTTEVSVEAYRRCVQARRCAPIPYYRGARRFDQHKLPVSMLRHSDAADYCTFVGGALPTEAQFERAARGLTRRVFPWGNLYHSQAANHGKLAFVRVDANDGSAELAPVHAFPQGATPEGVLNLAGNAAEWIRDRYLPYYVDNETVDPQGPGAASGSQTRVVRGGGYLSPRVLLRGAARDAASPDERRADRGFRCAYSTRTTNPR